MKPQKIDLFSSQKNAYGLSGVERFIGRLILHFDKLLNQDGDLNAKYQQCRQAKGESCADCSRKEYHKYNYGTRLAPDYSCREKTLIYAIRSMLCHAEEIACGLAGLHFSVTVGGYDPKHPWFSSDDPDKFNPDNIPWNSINLISPFKYITNQKEIKAVSIGYGSGADLLGLLYFFTNYSFLHRSTLNILRIDKHMQDWDFAAQETERFVRENANIPFEFSVEKADNNGFSENFAGQSQLFILSYVLNELNDEEMEQIFEKIRTLAADRCWILINERAYNENTEAYSRRQIDKFRDRLRNEEFCEANAIDGRIYERDADGKFLQRLSKSQNTTVKKYIHSMQKKYQMKIYADSIYYLGEFTR